MFFYGAGELLSDYSEISPDQSPLTPNKCVHNESFRIWGIPPPPIAGGFRKDSPFR